MEFNLLLYKTRWQIVIIPTIAFVFTISLAFLQYLSTSIFQFQLQLFILLQIFIFAIWEANLVIYRRLDKKITFFQNPKSRLIKQVIWGLFVTILTYMFVYWAFILILKMDSSLNMFLKYLYVSIIISFFINSLYVFKYLQNLINYSDVENISESHQKIEQIIPKKETHFLNEEVESENSIQRKELNSILIETGNKMLNIPFEEISYFISSEGMVELVKEDGQKIITNYSAFTFLNNRLPPSNFFQLNRQFIVNIRSIQSVKDDLNRKLIVQISTHKTRDDFKSVSVSRYRNAEFKKWISQQLSQKAI